MISPVKHAAFAAVIATGLGMLGSGEAAAMPVDSRLAALAANDSMVEQVRHRRYRYAPYRRVVYIRPAYRYGYVRPYWGPRYAYAPAYYSYAPAYYYGYPRYAYGYGYGYPRYGYWGGPRISVSFGFGPRFWW